MTASENKERILVTGFGAATSFGLGSAALYEGMLAGDTCVEPLSEPLDQLSPGYGSVVSLGPRDIRQLPNSRDMRPGTMTRYTFLSTLALGNAMAHGEIPWDDGDGALRRGFYVASYTNSDRFDKYVRFAHHVSAEDESGEPMILDSEVPQAIRKFSGFEFLKLMNNMPTAHGGIHARCQGPCNTFLGTPAGGVQAIGRAAEVIRDGLADTMYAGGVGSSVHPQMMMVRATRGLNSAPDLTPASAGRPFDEGATGIVPGEGGGVLVLERESTAQQRGATVYAELAGYGEWFTPPATPRGVPSSPVGTVKAIRRALENAGLEAGDLDLVVAHGEGSRDLDRLEALGLAEVLGPRAPEVPILSLTAHLGSTEAAVGPLSAGLALEVMAAGKIPGARNRENPLPEYKGPTGSSPIDRPVRTALVSVTTREGVNAAIVLRSGA
ncbi:MAG: beta-ketoacyl synthase N-terminal-like domain-containing protein [Myxococcota bacterium]|nr:beta-ketoacyl synthase N-terminal-like domain-containing protein [Myxococcota bacterium]